jgi:DNA-directed RNA polymerase subunit alpha
LVKKSLTEFDELVAVKNLNFGMDLAKYKLDKELLIFYTLHRG